MDGTNPLTHARRRQPPLHWSLDGAEDSDLADMELEEAYHGVCGGQGCRGCRGLGVVMVAQKGDER